MLSLQPTVPKHSYSKYIKYIPVLFSLVLVVSLLFVVEQVKQSQQLESKAAVQDEASTYVVFDDVLTPGWEDWSWGGVSDFSFVDQGNRMIAFSPSPTSQGGALNLHSNKALDIVEFSALSFRLKATSNQLPVDVIVYDTKGNDVIVRLSATTQKNPTTMWKEYSIRLSDLMIENKPISELAGIMYRVEQNSKDQQQLFVDDVQFAAPSY